MPDIYRSTRVTVHLDRLRFNAKQILAKLPEGQDAMAIIKAGAYGHGAVFCMRTLEGAGYKKFGVATLEEGLELRAQGSRSEIFVLDGLMGPPAEFLSNRLYPVLHSLSELEKLREFVNHESRDFMCALKFDTGMGRLGFFASQADEILAILKRSPQIRVTHLLTHLARADEPDEESVNRQYTLFRKLRDILRERGLTQVRASIANSAAILDGRLADYDTVRPGIALYGAYPHERQRAAMDLKPVLEFKTKILVIKKFGPESPLGYNATFVTRRESLIAVLPVGYADGYHRLVSNRGHVLVRGQKAPVVGRISMDLTLVDVTDVAEVAAGDDVTLIGVDGSEGIRAEDVAAWAETNSYEILCGITARVPRQYMGM